MEMHHIKTRHFLTTTFSAESLPDLSGKVFLVTSGKAAIAGLASRGARAAEAISDMRESLEGKETVLHGLVNNAGIMGVPFSLTRDGYEEGVRFRDPSLPLESSMTRYGQSKICSILHAKQLHALNKTSSAISTAAMHPGHIDTHGHAPASILCFMTPIMKCAGILDNQAKDTLSSLYAVTGPEFAESGGYVVPYAKLGKPSTMACDGSLQRGCGSGL
ncbi:hypothetical protein B0H67DRAFT_598796 [Lasiosphaeris hirsuta]|uniref:Uncharacterized protein n=1 Tax=Lasiosphaeris hirsuta TaxID=260670 RepID=A0AA40B155_9PEZI|nr:hypothetical protein B0H67DRAFT_598796 [Lasiosphaeris hirsuta]